MGVTEEIGRIMRSFSKSFSRKTKSKACGSTHEVVSVNTQPDLEDNNLTATMTEKYAEIEGLRAEIDSEAGALKTQLEVRNNYKCINYFLHTIPKKIQVLGIFMLCGRQFPSV
ncbi:uncharacterized protein LOC111867342 isoform X1 [Cryptotermes secundus]|uniref:uncharacterized protein LOC111867342 isoform X1 n=1 Tax=Cryptotermes secundus TaxID=105785 RepID=UPI000CD7B9BD|nr:uncharacterized protein LOC111867342 isoform X1 [Cryptotermes secundus]